MVLETQRVSCSLGLLGPQWLLRFTFQARIRSITSLPVHIPCCQFSYINLILYTVVLANYSIPQIMRKLYSVSSHSHPTLTTERPGDHASAVRVWVGCFYGTCALAAKRLIVVLVISCFRPKNLQSLAAKGEVWLVSPVVFHQMG